MDEVEEGEGYKGKSQEFEDKLGLQSVWPQAGGAEVRIFRIFRVHMGVDRGMVIARQRHGMGEGSDLDLLNAALAAATSTIGMVRTRTPR